MVIGTSNFSEVIDKAFLSRADLVLQLPLPDLPTRQALLQARVRTLRPLGLMLSSEELTTLAKESEGLSGRILGKIFPKTYCEKGVAYDDMSMEDVLATIAEAHMMKETHHGTR